MEQLLEIMRRLRDPDNGCPWDLKQTFRSIVPHTLEEAYEVADVIERGELDRLSDELGDLLFQVVFYAQLAEEQGLFSFADVEQAISDKLIRRHPHVFGEEKVADADEQTRAWEQHKQRERQARHSAGQAGVLHDVPLNLPALVRAAKLQRRVAHVGLDWQDVAGVFARVAEELGELNEAVASHADQAVVEAEVGDLLFSCVNLSRHLGIDPERALRTGNQKFERRVNYIESTLEAEGRAMNEADEAELDRLWEAAKRAGL